MHIFVEPTLPSAPKSDNAPLAGLLLAIILAVMALAQLFSFEKFVPLIDTYQVFGYGLFNYLVPTLLVVGEVFALPFLLRMRLSTAMRIVSVKAGWIALLLWLIIQISLVTRGAKVLSNGLLGSSVHLGASWVMVVFIVVLIGLMGWLTWAMWPFERSNAVH